jgi:hypothetical protein
MTIALLPDPVPQFCDANGLPYAGGSISTYVVGTTTPKQTWLDPQQAALNTNPIVLDAAGRCVMYGDGDYRLILRDAAGNLVWDQPSSTIVSAAMYPVVSAPTIADAQVLLGITGFATSADLANAISAEQNARIAADTAETNRAEAAEANLQSQIDAINTTLAGITGGTTTLPTVQAGSAITDSDGHKRVTFTTAFASAPAVTVEQYRAGYDITSDTVVSDASGFDVWFAFPETSGITPAATVSFTWIAVD